MSLQFMITVFLIDHPNIDELRMKSINKINYICGRKILLDYLFSFHSNLRIVHIYTGPEDLNYESIIRGKYDNIELYAAKSNDLLDFSGYKFASLIKSLGSNVVEDRIYVNSSCPLDALKNLITVNLHGIKNAALSVGAKSFQRHSTFKIRYNRHLQSYALRLVGNKTNNIFAHHCCNSQIKIDSLNISNQIQDKKNFFLKKEIIIEICELGFSKLLKNEGVEGYYIDEKSNLISFNNFFNFPFFDSRSSDVRFKKSCI